MIAKDLVPTPGIKPFAIMKPPDGCEVGEVAETNVIVNAAPSEAFHDRDQKRSAFLPRLPAIMSLAAGRGA
jgi:hypothetical protein